MQCGCAYACLFHEPAYVFHCVLAAARVEAQLEGLLLLLALAGPAGYLKNALLRRLLGCYAADCA